MHKENIMRKERIIVLCVCAVLMILSITILPGRMGCFTLGFSIGLSVAALFIKKQRNPFRMLPKQPHI